MRKNFVFDLGHVLTVFDAYALTRVYVKEEAYVGQVAETVFDRLYWDRLDAGTIKDEEVIAGFLSRLPENLREAGKTAYENWIINLTPIEGMPELVRDIKAGGGRVYLLSNTSVGLYEGYHRSPWMKELFGIFDGLVISGVVGLTKPGEEIYRYLLNSYGLKANETIFVDDNAANIAGCEKVGIEGYLFDGDSKKLRSYLGF